MCLNPSGKEGPLVVPPAAVVHTQGYLRACTDHADDPPAPGPYGTCFPGTGRRYHILDVVTGCARARCEYVIRGRVEYSKVASGNRVPVPTPQEPLLHEHVDARRKRAGVPALEERDRLHILLAAEHELGFPFATLQRLPDGERGTERDRHDAHPDEQCGHGVAGP